MFIKRLFMLYAIHSIFCFFSQNAIAIQHQNASSASLQDGARCMDLHSWICAKNTDSNIENTVKQLALFSQKRKKGIPNLFLYGSAAFLLYIKERHNVIAEIHPADLDFKLIEDSVQPLLKDVFNITDDNLEQLTKQILSGYEKDIPKEKEMLESAHETATSSGSCRKKILFESDDKKLSISMADQSYSKFMVSLYSGNDLQKSSTPAPALTIDFTCIKKSKGLGFCSIKLDSDISFTVQRIEYLINDAESMKKGMLENNPLDKAAFDKWRPRLQYWLGLEKKTQEIEHDNTDSQYNGCSTSKIVEQLTKLLGQEDTRTSCANLASEPAQDSTQSQTITPPVSDQPAKPTVEVLTATLSGLSLQPHTSENKTALHKAEKQPMETSDTESAQNKHQNNSTKALPADTTDDDNHSAESSSTNQSDIKKKKKKRRYNQKHTSRVRKPVLTVSPDETNNEDQDKNKNNLLPDVEPKSSANKKKKRRSKDKKRPEDNEIASSLSLPPPLSLPATQNTEKTQDEKNKTADNKELKQKLRKKISEARTPKQKPYCCHKGEKRLNPPRHERAREELEGLEERVYTHAASSSNPAEEITFLLFDQSSKTVSCAYCNFSEPMKNIGEFEKKSKLLFLKHFLEDGSSPHLSKNGCPNIMNIFIKTTGFKDAKELLELNNILQEYDCSAEFADENKRINSFNKSSSKEINEISEKGKEIFAAAGFFHEYKKRVSTTKCHSCKLLIKDIQGLARIHPEEEDEEKNKNQLIPWLIHIINAPFCPFLMKNLSDDFIDDIFKSIRINDHENPLRMTEEEIMSLIQNLRYLLKKAKGINSPKGYCPVHQHRQTTSPELPPGFV